MLLKKAKFPYVSKIQYGVTSRKEKIYIMLYSRRKKGFVFIHAIILCKYHDEYSVMAVADRYQLNPLKFAKQNVPWKTARRS